MMAEILLSDLPFDIIIEIARKNWGVWYKLSKTVRDFGLYSIEPSAKKAAQRHFQYEEHKTPHETYSTIGGVKHGISILYYNKELNKICTAVQYYAGLRQGCYLHYYSSGPLRSVQMYVNDLKHGEQIEYFRSGNKSFEAHFKEDKLDGNFLEYYDNENNDLWKHTTFSKGLKNGVEMTYHCRKISSKMLYMDGLATGPQVIFDADGNVTHLTMYLFGAKLESHDHSENELSACEFCLDIIIEFPWLQELHHLCKKRINFI